MTTKIGLDLLDQQVANTINNAASAFDTVGTSGQVLTSNGSALVWAEPTGGGGAGVLAYANVASLPLSNNATGSLAFVSETNRLYIWNSVGWFNIALINTSPTITEGPNPSYAFATDGTPIVLTLVASDPEGIPITWSSQVTSGTLGNTATIIQNNNVFTITPSTSDEDIGTFSVTFTASDGVNIATAASSFTLVFGVQDQFYNQSVVLTTSTVNNGNNNTFIDSSSNNVTITRNGNATQGAFSPFSPAGWSALLPTSQTFTLNSGNIFNFGSSEFTIEFWFYPLNTTGGTIIEARPPSTNGSFISLGGGTSSLGLYVNSTDVITSTLLPIIHTWNHIAISRSGGVTRLFVNGALGGSFNDTTSYQSSATVRINSNAFIGAAAMNFYIASLRVVNGTSLYSSAFTPPVEPLSLVTNTSFLGFQSRGFNDQSTNNVTITKGTGIISSFSPFLPLAAYEPGVHGGSAYFDGVGDRLDTPNNISLDSSENFTIEAWFYLAATGEYPVIADNTLSNIGPVIRFGNSGFGNKLQFTLSPSSAAAIYSTSLTQSDALNQWYHVAFTRSSGFCRAFLNGVQLNLGSGANPSTYPLTGFNSTESVTNAGFRTGDGFNGYMSGLRYVKGTALYTSSFTPPTAPPTPVANTTLLLNYTNANIFDETGKVALETKGGAQVSTSTVKYGGSINLNGTPDTVIHSYNADIVQFGTGDFTIEMWINLPVELASLGRVLSFTNASATTVGRIQQTGTNALRFIDANNVSAFGGAANIQLSLNTWTHVAFCRSGTTLRYFKDGVQVASGTDTSSYNTRNFSIGAQHDDLWRITAFISDLRITKGHARYTANFTPPTAKLGYNNAE